jgi:hypothetical protein
MKDYGKKLTRKGWSLNESVSDYDPESILYYISDDESITLQLKFIGEDYIRIAIGDSEVIEALQ